MSRKVFFTIGLLTLVSLYSSAAWAQGPSVTTFTVIPDTAITGQQFAVTVIFSEDMDTTSTYIPKITMGRAAPYQDNSIAGAWTDKTTYQASFSVAPDSPVKDGLYTFSILNFRNLAGDTLTTNPTIPAQKLLVDRSAPVTTHAFDNTVWYRQNAVVTFTAADTADGDNGAGLSKIYYSVNSGDTTVINVAAGTIQQNFQVSVGTEGNNNLIRYWAEDILGHKENTETLAGIKVDKTPPRASVSAFGSLQRTIAFDVPVSSSDSLSGVKWVKLYFRKQGENIWTLYAHPTATDTLFSAASPVPFVGEDNTVYDFEAVAIDSAGNVEARTGTVEATTRVDLVRPKLTDITFIHKFEVTDTVCFGDVTIELVFDVPMDNASVPVVTWGLNEPYNDFNIITAASNWITSKIWQGVFTVTPNVPEAGKDGHYGFRIQGANAKDTGRLMEPTLSFYENTPVPFDVVNLKKKLLVDRGAPFVSHSPAFNLQAWYKRIIFTINAADTAAPGLQGSGVSQIVYTLNGNEVVTTFDTPQIERSTPPDTIDTEGKNNTLSYYAKDFCGNSGMGSREVQLTGIKIDHTPPNLNVIAPTPDTSTSLVFDVYYDDSNNTDNLSGIRHVELWYRKDGGSWSRYGGSGAIYTSSPISFNATAMGEGVYDFEAVGVDSAGNRLRTGNAEWTTVVSLPKPTVSKLIWIYQNNETDTVGVGAVTLQLQFDRAMDITSVISVTYGQQPPYDTYNVSGQNTQWIDDHNWEGTFTISQGVPDCDGLYVFRIQGAIDADGFQMDLLNSYDLNGQFQKRLLIDRTPPVTIIRFDSTTYNQASGWWYGSDIRARVIAQDVVTDPGKCAGIQGAGVASFSFQVNNGPVSRKTIASPSVIADTTFTISSEGRNNSVRFWAVDLLGHAETVNGDNVVGGIKLDKTPPEATASSPDSSSTLAFNVAWSGADPISGGSSSGLSHVELWYRSDINRQWTKLGNFTSSPVRFTGQDDRVYEFEVVAVDSAGNKEVRRGVAESSTVIGTPKPLLTRVAFIYNNTIADTVAKGLTVIELGFNTKMDVTVTPKISYGLQPPFNTYNIPHIGTQWITDRIFQATFTISDDIPAVDGQYGFRISDARAAPDGLGTTMETTFSTNVNGGRLLLIDRAAPGAPTQIAVSPPGWTNANSVTISWLNPSDLSGVASAWYRIGKPPQGKRDGIQVEKQGIQSFEISTVGLMSGSYDVYLWLEDAAGNINQGNLATVTFKSDKVAPVFTPVSIPTEANEGESLTFSGTVVEDIGLDRSTSKLYYRRGGEASETAVDLSFSNGSVSATVPGSAVTSRGLYTRLVLADSAGNQAPETRSSVTVNVAGTTPAVTHPGGTTASAYRLISVPLNLDSPNAQSVLQDDLGDPAGGKNWRLLYWDPAANAFKEYPNVPAFEPGRSFFLISRTKKPITPGPGKSVRSDEPFRYPLLKGWNLIAVPFDFPLSSATLSLRSGADLGPIWGYEGAWNMVTTLEPWKGYALFVSKDDTLIFDANAPSGSQSKKRPIASAEAGEWSVEVHAFQGNARDEVNLFGVRNDALTGSDDADLHEPPIVSDVTVYFTQEDEQGRKAFYATDFRPSADDGYKWNLVVRTTGSGTVELEFPGIASVPANREVYLIDLEAKLARDLRKNNRYTYLAGQGVREKTLTVVVGSKQYVQENNQGVPLHPTKYQLYANYPNPFNPETTIRYSLPERTVVRLEIYNLLGQRVRTLVDGQGQEADFYVVHWDGRNDGGVPVASGVYITYLRAGKFVATRKMVLMK